MKIQPVAANAADIILKDGTQFHLHEADSHLYLNLLDGKPFEVSILSLDKSPDWMAVFADQFIRLSKIKEAK